MSIKCPRFFVLLCVFETTLSLAAEVRVPDDFPSIQQAIDAAQPGDTVLVSAGKYSERVSLKPGIKLTSLGDDSPGKLGLKRAEQTIIDGGGEVGNGAGVTMAEGAIIDGFTVQNVGVYNEEEWQKHFETHGEQQPYEHIGEPGVAGISAIGVNCQVTNNIVRYVGYSGIAIMGEPEKKVAPLVEGNFCYRNMGGGIGAMRGNTAIIRKNVCFENFFAGIGHDNASPVVIGNVCYGNVRSGIGISEGSSPIVKDNICYRNRRAGIGIRSGRETRPVVENNECYENEYAGIGIREEAAPVIRDNKCYRNKRAGIGSRTGASPVITGNECYENEQAGIGQMEGTHTTIIGNYIHHNKTSGIGFEAGQGGESQVINNRVIDNAKVAVGVNANWNVTFVGNHFSRSGGLPPIVMVQQGACTTFSNNVIRGGGVAGIRVAGNVVAMDNHFDGTSFRAVGPPNFAIWGLEGSHVTIGGNQINGWRHALSSNKGQAILTGNTVRHPSKAAFVVSDPEMTPLITGNILIPSKESDVIAIVDGQPISDKGNTISQEDVVQE